MKKLPLVGLLILTVACSSTSSVIKNHKQTLVNHNTFVITEMASDRTYGLSDQNPVEVGGVSESSGPLNERRFLNALTGPNGEKISYFRSGSCCPVKSNNGMSGMAMLDNYRVTYEGSKDTVSIYINMYDSSPLKAPYGFGIKK
ncbi:2-dehydro-3-deoxyphosphooctonate aldolase [Flavobacterium sp. SM2513]|uniref:2-dehydro-3-deoxyphosphooctonate aldolase n=1 Tax=Flavobacterium sp. SM2513 TaxID=3424766 RepID=UPI003D7FC62D